MHCYMPISPTEFAVGFFCPPRNATKQTKTSKGTPAMSAQFITVGKADSAESAARFVNYLNGGTGALPVDNTEKPAPADVPDEGPPSGF